MRLIDAEVTMNDNDIIKALKCQLGIDTSNNCFGCLYRENKSCINASECILKVVEDLINRQKAEIERLTINMNAFGLGMKREKERADTARAEAIKEFAERAKDVLDDPKTFGEWSAEIIVDRIDNLAKEMTGGVRNEHH